MGSERCDQRNRNCGNHRIRANSLLGLIFGIVSFSITLAFKIVGAVFQVIFGVLSGVTSGARGTNNPQGDKAKAETVKDGPSYTINNMKQETASERKPDENKTKINDNIREFKKHENSKAKAGAAAEKKSHTEEAHNKDFYVVLFILTIIPSIVALAMGKLLYAGAIGAAGFGLMIITGMVSGIVDSIKKSKAERKAEAVKEEPEEDDSVEKLIKDAFEKLFEIRKDIAKIGDAEVSARLEGICCTGEKIIGEVRTNPESLSLVRKFFYYYLGAFGEIIKKYLRLSNFEESSEEVGKLVAETERSFADIDCIFKELCEKLLEKDMMHLKAEINVIKNSN